MMVEIRLEDCRPEVHRFAILMETVLRRNDHKGGWKHLAFPELVDRVFSEALELRDLWMEYRLRAPGAGLTTPMPYGLGETWEDRIGAETADIANFCMMLADVCGCLEEDAQRKRAMELAAMGGKEEES
jgi:hypothetical protein